MDLFESDQPKPTASALGKPLASRMRPRALDEVVGQSHLIGPGRILRRAVEADRLTSVVFYGPPGTGKTSLAHVIAAVTQAAFLQLNATSSGVADLRKALADAKDRERRDRRRTILFVDEIHRFNKAQQDVLMPDVERGNPILIGATTENPFFSIVSALLSRSLVCELKPLAADEVQTLMKRALADKERGLGRILTRADDDALSHLAEACDGDARRALNALEVAVVTTPAGKEGVVHVTRAVVEESIQKKAVVYDTHGDAHYDTASAFIKSMRGSDPDATLYWMAKMLYAGEDPRFVARRMVICASEDVGNADPQALVLAVAALHASEFVGMPECRIPLAQAAVYIACAPKSNAAYMGINKAMGDVESGRTLAVPAHLQDAHYKSAAKLGRGVDYKYAHDYADHYVAQVYLQDPKTGETPVYYEPTDQGHEQVIKQRLERLRQLRKDSTPKEAPIKKPAVPSVR